MIAVRKALLNSGLSVGFNSLSSIFYPFSGLGFMQVTRG